MTSLEKLRALLREEAGDEEGQGAHRALERALRGEQPLGATLAYLASRPCYAGDLASQALADLDEARTSYYRQGATVYMTTSENGQREARWLGLTPWDPPAGALEGIMFYRVSASGGLYRGEEG